MDHHRASTVVSGQGGEEVTARCAAAHSEAQDSAPRGLSQVVQPGVAFRIDGVEPLAEVVVEALRETHHALGVQALGQVNKGGFRFGCFVFVHHASSRGPGSSTAMKGRASHASSWRISNPFRPAV